MQLYERASESRKDASRSLMVITTAIAVGLWRGRQEAADKAAAAAIKHTETVFGLRLEIVDRDMSALKNSISDVKARMVRRYQPASDGLHVLITVCFATSAPAPCDAALNGAQFTVPHPISLHDSTVALSYWLGAALGKLFVFVAPLLALYYLIRWRSRARAAAVKAAGPPGSPPGPGAAGDGR